MAIVPPQPPPPPQSWLKRVIASPVTWSIVLILGTFLFIVFLVTAGTRPFVDQLPNQEFARGIITLVFVFFTIGFAAIVLIHGLFFSDGATEDRRFARGREVLGLFIGIVGTIVGFYFGSADKPTTRLDVAVQADREADKKVVVRAFAIGGTSPYQFSITIGDKKVTDPPIRSADGWLTREVDGDSATELTVEVTDAKDLRATKKEKIRSVPTPPKS